MLSMPPATTMSAEPATIRSCASIAAFIADPHILLTVVQPTASGTPALSDACRAGAWPWPAGSTLPMITSSHVLGRDARALDRRLDRDRAEIARGKRSEIA